MSRQRAKPDPAAALERLKDFQRKTAAAAFARLYRDGDAVDRFLIADEVGLGKTLIARAVIAQAVAHMWNSVERIDVVYVCSNAEIARQNIRRLDLDEDGEGFTEASRLTLLPLYARGLSGKKLNFVSLTPSTSLDLRGSQGAWRERALLYCLLAQAWGIKHVGAKNLLQGQVGVDRWRNSLSGFLGNYEDRDDKLIAQLVSSFAKRKELRARYEDLAERSRGGARARDAEERRDLIGELRRVLAKECLDKLEPDLVILDEFQRFKHLLDFDDEVADLAKALFEYKSSTAEHERVRILLLSATPYKMFTRSGDQEDHHADFLRTVRFLLQDDSELATFKQALRSYREALSDGELSLGKLREARVQIERVLRRVMCRTERLGVSVDRNGMVREVLSADMALDPDDIEGFAALDRVARATQSGDTVEIWKSAPLPMPLMDKHYALKRKLAEQLPANAAVRAPLEAARAAVVPVKTIEAYEPLHYAHARTREIVRQTVDAGAWRLLWIPPSAPYWNAPGAYGEAELGAFTKRLIFSSWKVAPKAIAGVVSYEAERRMVAARPGFPSYSKLYDSVRPILRFAESKERLTGLSFLTLFYPSCTWATRFDPLQIALSLGGMPSSSEVLNAVEEQVKEVLQPFLQGAPTSGPADQRWYWAAPLLLDRGEESLKTWLSGKTEAGEDNEWAWPELTGGDSEDSAFARHVEAVRAFVARPADLGRPPDDLLGVLAKVIIASPAVVSLRALLRLSASASATVEHLGAAGWIAMGFRTLFSLPETQLYLRGADDDRYWERALDECVAGNLQAVMDEYAHVLHEAHGGAGERAGDAYTLAEEMGSAVALRTSKIEYDDLAALVETRAAKMPSGSLRCRFALRFGDGKTHDDEDLRTGTVRAAFNSPFRPFVLASTSVGQEGLDFHPYCHAIVHWNLPSNPVDFEQREGRIHRYKGHFVRKNLAARYGLAGLAPDGASRDPWRRLFKRAADERHASTGDLVPYWLFEGEHRIERHVPVLPLSRDGAKYEEMKAALALYRVVFGQPRQEELLRLLDERWDRNEIEKLLAERIDLQPR